MGPQKKMESSAKEIEKELNADPRQRQQMREARFLAGGLSDSNSRKRGEAREKLLARTRSAIRSQPRRSKSAPCGIWKR
jgi:hypothetical protein